MTAIKEVSRAKCFGGSQIVFSHESEEVKCKMNVAVYLPPQADSQKVPVIYWLSGLTCSEQNFITKAGAQSYAAKFGVCLVAPDTSPRGLNIEGETDSWDFGAGAGFYLDATTDKWKTNYRMYSYVTKELPRIVGENFPVLPNKQSIMGHSMGGHGALISYLKNPGKYLSVSAFAPICNPCECAWGQKAFTGYLGENKEAWKEYDSTYLIRNYSGPEILIDQGEADSFLPQKQLLPDHLLNAGETACASLRVRYQPGYDHSYYFISTFIGEHIEFHAKRLFA